MEWIKCSERMPDPDSKVIAYTSWGQIIFDMHYMWSKYDSEWISEATMWRGIVTHWMPIPNPPED